MLIKILIITDYLQPFDMGWRQITTREFILSRFSNNWLVRYATLAEFNHSYPPLFAVLTPPGRAAVAVVAVWDRSPDGWQRSKLDWIGSLFSPANPRRWQAVRRDCIEQTSGQLDERGSSEGFFDQLIFYGTWKSTGEDVLLLFFSDRCEIHCHGGIAAVAAITESLQAAGAKCCDQQAAAERLSGSPGSPWMGALVRGLSRTGTERTAQWMLAQWTQHDRLAGELIRNWREDHSRFLLQVQAMLDFASFGQHLTEPWSVVLCGPPNAGKSSLINALVGFERAIVHSVAGTTRDVVSQLAAVEGWPIELKDTAGLRQAEEPIEKRGVEMSVDEIQQADLVLLVFTESEPLNDSTLKIFDSLRPPLLVCNKIDLAPPAEKVQLQAMAQRTAEFLRSPELVFTSAIEPRNLGELIQLISRKLVPALPANDLLIPIELSQVAGLQQIIASQDPQQTQRILKQLFGNHRGLG
jgi:tRNA modification GTPase